MLENVIGLGASAIAGIAGINIAGGNSMKSVAKVFRYSAYISLIALISQLLNSSGRKINCLKYTYKQIEKTQKKIAVAREKGKNTEKLEKKLNKLGDQATKLEAKLKQKGILAEA